MNSKTTIEDLLVLVLVQNLRKNVQNFKETDGLGLISKQERCLKLENTLMTFLEETFLNKSLKELKEGYGMGKYQERSCKAFGKNWKKS